MGGAKDRREAKQEREAAKKEESSKKAQQAKEDAYWREAGEGQKSKSAKKKEDDDARKQEAAAKKLEAKRLAEQEEAEMASSSKGKAAKAAAPKVTAHQLAVAKEAEKKKQEEAAAQKALASRKEVDEKGYDALVNFRNTNREDDLVDATGMDEAIKLLQSLQLAGGDATPDKHPEKRLRAAWAQFEEAELPALMQDKPGLKRQQYREMLWKQWLKSPQNPLVQARAAAAAAPAP